jgi:spermidine/putrescine ABC transporter ATP-binding subunit
MSTVDVRGVSKRYGETSALDDVSLTLANGEFFGLLGPSGSGKTTLLRAIAGFVEPDGGEIRIDGQDVSGLPIHRRDIGMVFQNYALFPHMSVYDNVAFSLSVRRTSPGEIARRVGEMLELVRLSGYEGRRPRQLSGGQQQRIALARALVSRPRVLLLDEPLGALDKSLRQQMQIELRQIQREVGITTVFVTHDQEEALTLSDRIAIFRDGYVVQIGTPQAVYERPATAFAAEFLGAANFLTGRVGTRKDGYARVILDDASEVATGDPLPVEATQVRLSIRPEKFSIHLHQHPPELGGKPVNVLPGRIVQPIYMGASITYRIAVAGTEFSVFQQNRDAHIHAPGDSVWLAWSPDHSAVLMDGA